MTMIGLSPPAFVPSESSSFDRGANSAAFGGEKKFSPFSFSPRCSESVFWHWEWKAASDGWAFGDLPGKENSGNSTTLLLGLLRICQAGAVAGWQAPHPKACSVWVS